MEKGLFKWCGGANRSLSSRDQLFDVKTAIDTNLLGIGCDLIGI